MSNKIIVPTNEAKAPPTAAVFFTREALRRLWRSRRTSSVAVAMIAIALFIFGVFLLLAENLKAAIDRWEGTAKVTVYLELDAPPAAVERVRAHLTARPMFQRYHFVTREQALEKFKGHFASLSSVLEQLDENPFPHSFEIEVTDAIIQNPRFDDEINALRSLRGVDDVQFDWQWITQVKSLIRVLYIGGLIAGGILAIAAAFTTANVIRLSLVLYREEISIMRLVGATETMIRGPFLLQGLLQGMVGALVAIALLYACYLGGRAAAMSSPSFVWDFLVGTFLPWQKTAYLALGGMAAGVAGSWLSLGEFSGDEITAEA